jgi:SAM-dependent methyltransferase
MVERELTVTEQKQRAYYNRIAGKYDDHFASPAALQYRAAVLDSLFRHVAVEGQSALDAMCGGGENTHYLIGKGAVVTGLDISEKQCEIYRRRFPGCRVTCASILATNLDDRSFDLVMTESLHHLHPYVDQAVAEIGRVLKPGGLFVLWEPPAGAIPDFFRKIWYRLDQRYFEENERSIDVRVLRKRHDRTFEMLRCLYGGNVAHVFVQGSIFFRIPPSWVRFYAPALIRLDRALQILQTRLTSCWVLALFQKRGIA